MAHGPLDFKESPGLAAAKRAAKGEKRKPTATDAPPPSLFPPSAASRAARELSNADNRGRDA